MRFSTAAVLVLLVTALLYLPTLRADFVYEDGRDAHMTLNPADTWRQMPSFRTVPLLSRALEMQIFGIQPWGFHLGSLLWHLLNVLLLLAVAWLVLPPWGAIAAAGVFAWHPIQVEAVAYVSARADLCAAAGVLLAVLSTSRGSRTGAVVGLILASVSKETAIVAWGLVPLWAAWTAAPAFPWLTWVYLAGAGAVAVLATAWRSGITIQITEAMLGQQLAAVERLIGLVFLPRGFTIDHDWAALAPFAPIALILALTLTAWAVTEGWWGRHWLAFAWLWTLVALSPRLVVPLYEGLHERHFVVPMIGWSLCAGHWLGGYRVRAGERA